MTVVQEQACNVQEYAQQDKRICDLVLPNDKALFSDETLSKDISKLLIRHDDRDNAVLQGTTKLDSYKLSSSTTGKSVLDLVATTTIPSGGTYRDGMGIDQPNTIDRRVKARAVLVSTANEGGKGAPNASILSIWLSAALDDWQKPIMGIKLNQIWDSVEYAEETD